MGQDEWYSGGRMYDVIGIYIYMLLVNNMQNSVQTLTAVKFGISSFSVVSFLSICVSFYFWVVPYCFEHKKFLRVASTINSFFA